MSEPRSLALIPALAAAGTLLASTLLAGAALAQEPRLQDPMRPPAQAESQNAEGEQAAGLSLTAVLVSASRRIAVVNGQIYREGDRVNGEEIVAIEPGAILIRRDGAAVRLRVRDYQAVTTRNDGVEGQ